MVKSRDGAKTMNNGEVPKQPIDPTGLTLKGTAELGRSLIQQAQEANRAELQRKITAEVQSVMQSIRGQEQMKDLCERNLRVFRERLAAIERGDFHIDANGQLQLNDEKLAPAGLNR